MKKQYSNVAIALIFFVIGIGIGGTIGVYHGYNQGYRQGYSDKEIKSDTVTIKEYEIFEATSNSRDSTIIK